MSVSKKLKIPAALIFTSALHLCHHWSCSRFLTQPGTQICISSVLRPFVLACFWSLLYLFCSSCLLFEMLLNVFLWLWVFYEQSMMLWFTAACTKLLMHLLLFHNKNDCLYCVETMQKLIKGGTAHSQSSVSCIQIWSHFLYWQAQDCSGAQFGTEDVPTETKETETNILMTQIEGT